MKKIALLGLILAFTPLKSWAWYENEAAYKAINALFNNLETVQHQFVNFTPSPACHPDVYMPIDIDNDGVWEIWVRTHDGKAGVLYAQDKNGGLYTVAEDSKSDDVVINGNLVKVISSKHAGVTQAILTVMKNGLAEQATFVEESTYDGKNGKTTVKYLTEDGKAASSAETKKFFAKVTKGTEYSEKNFFELSKHEFVNTMGRHLRLPSDITIKEHPIFVAPEEYAKNTFLGISDVAIKSPQAYTKMVFKPHITDVKFVKMAKDNDFNFRMVTPSFTKKMFRGYEPYEATPIIVKDSWFKTHHPLQFSRWKFGEKMETCKNQWMLDDIKFHYKRGIKSVHWIADIPSGERHFYIVVFEHKGEEAGPFNALASLVCFAEGELVSTFDFWGRYDSKDPYSVWRIDDDGDFGWPELSVIAGTDDGLEIYMRHPGPEGGVFYCVREVGNQFIEVYGNSQYWGGN